MSINGRDCQCAAQHEGQCSCGCDWTTPKEARLEALNAELLVAAKALVKVSASKILQAEQEWKALLAAIAKATESGGER